MLRIRESVGCALIASAWAVPAQATLVTFTGGTVVRFSGPNQTTNNSLLWDDVDYYEEGGFRLDFLPNSGSGGFATNIGDYYGVGNDVIHAHWDSGGLGGVTSIELTQLGPGTFDFNYFTLTSNTQVGGGHATGAELAYVRGFLGGIPTGPAVLLPSEDWGFPATQVGLGKNFDKVDKVVFSVANEVACFGMDDFYINEVPAPSSLALGALFGGLALRRRR